jgi:hypothetical protein
MTATDQLPAPCTVPHPLFHFSVFAATFL